MIGVKKKQRNHFPFNANEPKFRAQTQSCLSEKSKKSLTYQ